MKRLVINFILLICIYGAKAQPEPVFIDLNALKTEKDGFFEAKDGVKTGDFYYNQGNTGGYTMALEFYTMAYEYNPDYAPLNYKIGLCRLGSIQKRSALEFLLRAYAQKPDVSPRIYYNLARAYQYNVMFDKALEYYELYKQEIRKEGNPKELSDIDKKMEECRNGKLFENYPTEAMVVKLNSVNSIFPDYCPLISADESVLIFTSRRDENVGGVDKTDGIFYEDIYISENKKGIWSKARNIGTPLNTRNHDATVGLSPDGQQLFLYRDMDIYVSNLSGTRWTEPEALPSTINTEENENSACISFDGNMLFFVRGRTGDPATSNGDIWVSKKYENKWQKAEKLPQTINTSYDEDGVFFHPDGRTLYFSSKGHNSMGGYDIFRSQLQKDGSWSKPENLGFPVNSPDDDIYFVMAAKGTKGYYSSVKKDGEGFMDIYEISFPEAITYDDAVAMKQKSAKKDSVLEEKKVRLTLVTGFVSDGISGKPVEATIEITDNKQNKQVLQNSSNSATGKYLVSLPSGANYGMSVKADNYLFYSENFDIPEDEKFSEIEKNIKLYPVQKEVKVVLRNIFFDFDRSTLKQESFPELDRLKKLLNDNPTIHIEISGHTDNTGTYVHNVDLSKNRAQAVVKYLEDNGIASQRLQSRGASWDEPIADNKTEKGRQLNRRVEFKIISK